MRIASCLLAALLVGPLAAFAQQPPTPAAPQAPAPSATIEEGFGLRANEIDFGVRMTSVEGDPGRYQRMRDLRSGPTLDRLSYSRERTMDLFQADADHVGYRDQHYRASIERFGKFELSFDWNQIPLFYTDVTRSPWVEASDGVFRLDDGMQAAAQQGNGTQVYNVAIDRFDTRSRRDIAGLRFGYDVTREVKLLFALTSTHRTGEQPWASSFGFPNADELAAPVDHRTNDITTAAEWSNQRGMVRVAYDGSWFNNNVDTLIWDNPLRLTDSGTGEGPSQGRMALWPDSTAHTVSASGSMALPGRSRAFAYVSVGSWLQDADLLPHTINSAITPIPLVRESAEAEARIVAMTYRFTSRPTPTVWLSGQYRLYDYDNRTEIFPYSQYVTMDTSLSTSSIGENEPFGYTRHFFDVDASFTPWRAAAFRVGYGQEHDNRTFRHTEETTDRVVRASIDSQGFSWGSVRLQYDYSKRVGEGLDEQVLDDVGEQTSLRQFDISDRNRHRLSLIGQAVATDTIAVNGSISIGLDERPDDQFGVLEGDFHSYTIGVDFTPIEQVGGSITYGFEQTTTRQKSRQANPGVQFDDPTRDWFTDMDQDVHTVGLRLDFARNQRTTFSVGYDYVGSRSEYLYSLAPVTTLATPEQLRPVWNIFQYGNVDARHTLTRQIALGFGYRYEHYHVEDFAFGEQTLVSPLINAFTNLMNQWRPFNTHSGYVRLLYTW